MTDKQFTVFMLFITEQLRQRPPSNAGPRVHEMKTYTIEDEAFSRWMGWRGQEAQERETDWPAEELKAERQNRSYRALWKENRELKGLLNFIRQEIGRIVPADGP